MPRTRITAETKQELRNALSGLAGARAVAEVGRWATLLDVDKSRIYEVTKDLRPERKQRADKGKRRADLKHPLVEFALERIIVNRLDPDVAIETTMAQPEFKGQTFPVSLGTLRRYLRQNGLDRKQRRHPRHAHRSWEAKAPREIFQFDITGLKERWWADVNTRRILHLTDLDVSRNHPNENKNRVKVWSFHLVDDYSRLRYVRFVAVDKPNTAHVIEFLWAAFREMGIPQKLYTDNDPIIVSRRMRRAADVFDRVFADSGGFKLEQHRPGNPRATGKVEVGHQIMEAFWNIISLKSKTPSFESLNLLAERVCEKKNREVNRATGMPAVLRFNEGHAALRMPPAAVLDSAFKANCFEVTVTGSVTFKYDGAEYQLPRSANLKWNSQIVPNPFLSIAGRRGMKMEVVWPPEADYFVAIVDGTQFELDRVVAQADAAGDFRTVADSVGQQAEKAIRESARVRRKANKAAGTEIVAPGLDVDFEVKQSPIAANTTIFPKKQIAPEPADWARHGVVAPSLIDGQPIDLWSAAELLKEEGAFEPTEAGQIAAHDMTWLKSVFAGRDEIKDTELRAAVELRSQIADSTRVVAMRSA